MHQFKKSKFIVLLSSLILLSWLLLTLSHQSWFKENKLLSPIQSVLAAGDRFLAKGANAVSGFGSQIDQLLSTYRENQRLKKSLLDLAEVRAENQTLKAENNSLRESLTLEQNYGNSKSLVAEVLYRNPSSWAQSLGLSGGSQSGVAENMLVVANGGVIGRVVDVTETSSRVSLLTDINQEHNLAVKINLDSGAVYGIITAYDPDQGVYVITQLNNATGLSKGQQVVTSDLSETLPSQLLIGSVESVTKNKSGIETEVKVKPAADFTNIYSVLLIGK